jgi:acetyltransferase-like isoleucine patch superfamily enzyme
MSEPVAQLQTPTGVGIEIVTAGLCMRYARRLVGNLVRKLAAILDDASRFNRTESMRKYGANIGKNVFFEGDLSDYSNAPFLTIEDGATVSHGTVILLHDSALNNTLGLPIKFGKVVIGKESYVGANCTILCGVRIGERAIVGSHSLVTKDIPDEAVAYGVPARVQGTIHELAERHKANMKADADDDRYHYLDIIPWRDRVNSQLKYRADYLDFIERSI